VLGSGRIVRHSEKAARYVYAEAEKYGKFKTEFLDVREYVLSPFTGRHGRKELEGEAEAKIQKWSETMTRADGLIIVAPEYNHGYPGELKLLLDSLFTEYKRKPVGICGAGGRLGGARMVEVLRIALIELQMAPIRLAVYFSNVYTLFDDSGNIKDASYEERLKNFFDELVWYARALKAARNQADHI
jgi:NAD(P)H-dependent FMN reductase